MLFSLTFVDTDRKTASSIPTTALAIVGPVEGIGRGGRGGVLLGTSGRGGQRAATREELLVFSLIMMDILCDSPDNNNNNNIYLYY